MGYLVIWGSVITYTSDRSWKKKALWFDKKVRIFSAGSVALITLAVIAFWSLAPAWAAQPTVLNPIPNQSAMENIGFNFQFAANTFEDAGHTLTYSAELTGGMSLPAWLSFNAATRTFSGTPSNGDVDTITIDVIADDGEGANATDTFDITVTSFNSAPTVANPIPDQDTNEDSAFNFQFAANTFDDQDFGDILTYSAASTGGGGLPAWLSFDAVTRTFSGTPQDDDIGTISIDVTADDGNGSTVTDTFRIFVDNTYDPPTLINPIPNQTAMENNVFNLRFAANTFKDDGSDSLTYSAQLTGGGSLPAWLEFTSDWRTFRGTPSNSDIGSISIDLTADDEQGGVATDTFTITVVAAQVYSGAGDGLSKESAYLITDCEQLQEMSNNLGAWYRLAGDIDCSDTVNWNGGAGFSPVGSPGASFLGTLDGGGYTISDLTVNRPTTDHVGLFGYISAYISIGSVGQFLLEDVSIRGQNYVGGVVGESWGTVSKIGITGEVNGTHIVGGVTGNNSFVVSNVYSHAAIGGVPSSSVGGGLVGQNGGFITNSYSTGIVPVGPGKGGLIGDDFGSGGVFGSFWDTQTSGIGVSDEGTGKTTLEMKNVATFTDTQTAGLWVAWDFVGNPNNDTADDDIWDIDPLVNQGYPYLVLSVIPESPVSEPPVDPTIRDNGAQQNPSRTVAVARQSTPAPVPTPAPDSTADDSAVEVANPNTVTQTDYYDASDTIKKPDTSDTGFIPWVIGFLFIALLVTARHIYRRAHSSKTK